MLQEQHGYIYYTRVRIENCAPYGHNEFGPAKALLLFKNIQAGKFDSLDSCGSPSSNACRISTLTKSKPGSRVCDSIKATKVATNSSMPSGTASTTCC